jgi:fatty acid desaturase
MPAVARLDPKTIFTPAEWAQLTRRNDLLGLGLVAHAWAVIAAAGALFIVFPNPFTYIVAVMVIGARQLGLAILMHEAAHGGLAKNQALNDFFGHWLCGAPVGANLKLYRPYHLQHHRYTEQPEDPDKALSAPFPIARKCLWRKALRDLSGQTFFKQRIAPVLHAASKPGVRAEGTGAIVAAAGPFWLTNAVLFLALAAFGLWWAWVALWLVPMATWFPLVTRLRNIAEHACVPGSDDPLRHARTTAANVLERLLIAPYWVHFHAEHHAFMHVPAYRLEGLHKALIAKGHGERMILSPSYRAVLANAAPA